MVPVLKRRRLVELLILGLVVATLVHTWLLAGLFVPLEIAGPSMAETLLGRHHRARCSDCGARFAWDAPGGTGRRRVACPNCGFAASAASAAEGRATAGDRVLVARFSPALPSPRRWEPVVARHPGRESQLAVKRVVGLPGETIELRGGDLFVDGQLQRKTLAQQRAMAVLVHDARWLPSTLPEDKLPWRPIDEGSLWNVQAGVFSRTRSPHKPVPIEADPPSAGLLGARSDAGGRVDWLVFGPGRRFAGAPDETFPAPVTSLRGYNQVRQPRSESVYPVRDVMLSAVLDEFLGAGFLYLAATDGEEEFCVRIDRENGLLDIFRNGVAAVQAMEVDGFQERRVWLELSLFDRQLLLAVNGREQAKIPLEEGGEPALVHRPLAIGSDGPAFRILRLAVFRDIYYPPAPSGSEGPGGTWRLSGDQYFVLGDNSVFSEDSRVWHPAQPIDRRALVGKPFAVHWPSRRIGWGDCRFQVPDPSRIRYIR